MGGTGADAGEAGWDADGTGADAGDIGSDADATGADAGDIGSDAGGVEADTGGVGVGPGWSCSHSASACPVARSRAANSLSSSASFCQSAASTGRPRTR
ncbi:hypothetical protein [Streptomyces sp. A2-16]|uniref:hypothetical protein n=1 Tax=Streptomyces sp. A2-16 TaxID=2781734 RepID=UPI0032C24AC8